MEMIVLLAVIAAAVVLRKQQNRLTGLEGEIGRLRQEMALLSPQPAGTAPMQQAEEQIPAVSREAGQEDDRDDLDEEPIVAGPWGSAAAEQAQLEPMKDELPVAAAVGAPRERRDLETTLGTRWAVWVGGIALALGGIFLVRYSIEAGIFGPGVRLTAAGLFGLLLAAAGEVLRRRGVAVALAGEKGVYIPAILTAASIFTLFSTVYAAYAFYGFIGTGTAFALLALIALATMVLALLHGQALAGLGLLGSYLTPVLVSSDAPNVWALFGYLTVVLVAAMAVSALRRWRFLSTAAVTGAGLWSIFYLAMTFSILAAPVVTLQLSGLAALCVLWLARPQENEKRPDPASLMAAIFVFAIATMIARSDDMPELQVVLGMFATALLVAAIAGAAWRERATPLLHAAGMATLAIASWPLLGAHLDIDILYGRLVFDGIWMQPGPDLLLRYTLTLGAFLLGAGVVVARRSAALSPMRAAGWAFWAALAPNFVLLTAWLTAGDLNIDWRFAAVFFALAAILAAAAEIVARAEKPAQAGGWAVTCLAIGATASLCLGLVAGFGPLVTTILTGLAAAVPAALTRVRSWSVLGWLSAAFAGMTLARIGIDPTLAGADFLSTTPLLNALLPGYALPAAAFAYAAWQLARTGGMKPRLAMEAFAALFALLGAAMLVRHAMNGGIIDVGEPMLAEQSIYTLIMIGGGAILLALDRRSPSPVFRFGSMGLGVLSVLTIASSHLLALNPLWTNESTGTIPVLNLLLLAYLLPATAMAALAWRARRQRPDWYVGMLAGGSVVLAFAYVSLSIRRIFHGEFIGAWKGMDGLETYTYSAVWLVLGVVVLAAGARFGSRALRLGSAALVVAAVAKVFLYDMRELEGVLRALSFMGLGAVLIGIGLFYQRMLATGGRTPAEAVIPPVAAAGDPPAVP